MGKISVVLGIACIRYSQAFWGFEENQFDKRVRALAEYEKELGFTVYKAGPSFENADEALKMARTLNTNSDIAILDIATYPEGKAAGVFFDELKLPLILWSRPESEFGTHIGHNSFCGANFLASNLFLRKQRFRSIFGTMESAETKERLQTAVRLIETAKHISGSTIGEIGEGIVPKFFDIDIRKEDRETLEKRWRIRFQAVALEDVLALAQSYPEDKVQKRQGEFMGSFRETKISESGKENLTRLLMSVKEISDREDFAAISFRCWPELQTLYSAWPCSILSSLNQQGLPAACEGDPGGALDMLLAKFLSPEPSTLMDIVDWDDRKNTLSLWHCGPTACSWASDRGATLMPHNVDGKDESGRPAPGLPGIVDMEFKPGPVTFFRTMGAVDDEFVVQGNIAENSERRICGSFGEMKDIQVYGRTVPAIDLRNIILERCLPHHYTLAQGHVFSV
jgi:L-fucose isomerase-like protein